MVQYGHDHSLFMNLDDSVYNGNVPSFNVEHNNLSYSDWVILQVGQE